MESGAPPRLPSPRGDVYVRSGPQAPTDPLVARVMTSVPARWDEALSGAAAGVALALLAGDPPDDARIRWSAVRAGYPYPVVGRAIGTAAQGGVPETVRSALIAEGRAGRDVGLVRARSVEEDLWVLLVAEPRANVGAVQREVPVAARIPLAADVWWRAAGPDGNVETLADAFSPDTPGCWLLQALDGRGTVATLPVFVDVPTPELPPLYGVPSAATTEDRVLLALAALHADGAPVADSALASIARARLRDISAGAPLPDAQRQLAAAGFDDGGTTGACRAATLEACLQAMWWSPEDHAAVGAPWPLVGVAASAEAGAVSVVVVAAR